MSKGELAWQLQDNAVRRFYLTMYLGFWRITIVWIEDNVLKSKWFEKITYKIVLINPSRVLSDLLFEFLIDHMNFPLEFLYKFHFRIFIYLKNSFIVHTGYTASL
jgi:hypothetical protein